MSAETGTQGVFLGLDVGTTAVKAVLVAADGVVVAEAEAALDLAVPRPGWTEQDPEAWWRGCISATQAALADAPAGTEVAAVGLSGQMHSAVVLDAADEVIRPAILWNDVRTSEQCREIERRVGTDGLRRMVGNPALEGFTAPKLLWLAQHEPESYERVRTVLLAKDFVRLRMTGEKVTEPSDAAGTLLFDVATSRWAEEILSALDVDPDWLPRVAGSSEVTGRLSPGAAESLGLRTGTPVVGGGADNAAAAVGAGVIEPGTMSVSVGTSGAVVAPIASPQVDPEMRLHVFNHAAPDTWYLMGVVLSAGSALAWWRKILTSSDGSSPSYDELVEDASPVPVGSQGLTFLPYLTGERTPHADANARGVFSGLHAGHERADMVRAVMEGVTFALRDSLELMRSLGVTPSEIVMVGGGAQSRVWRQMVADVFSTPVATTAAGGGAPYGAAMLAACGAGKYSSPAEAAAAWLRGGDRLEPDRLLEPQYEDACARYRALYPRLKEQFANAAQ